MLSDVLIINSFPPISKSTSWGIISFSFSFRQSLMRCNETVFVIMCVSYHMIIIGSICLTARSTLFKIRHNGISVIFISSYFIMFIFPIGPWCTATSDGIADILFSFSFFSHSHSHSHYSLHVHLILTLRIFSLPLPAIRPHRMYAHHVLDNRVRHPQHYHQLHRCSSGYDVVTRLLYLLHVLRSVQVTESIEDLSVTFKMPSHRFHFVSSHGILSYLISYHCLLLYPISISLVLLWRQ